MKRCVCLVFLLVGNAAGQALGQQKAQNAKPPATSVEPASTELVIEKLRKQYHAVRGREATVSRTGRLEGELNFEMRGTSRVQAMQNFGPSWSGNAHLLWDGKVGDQVQTAFEVVETGTYDLIFQFTLAPDYGRFEFELAGTPYEVDLFDSRVRLSEPLEIENLRLEEGRQVLEFSLVGANDRARPFRKDGYLFGLDYLQLKRLDPEPVESNPPANQIRDSEKIVSPLPFERLRETTSRYCADCHSGKEAEGEFDLQVLAKRENLLEQIEKARKLRNTLVRHQMPPEDSDQPDDLLRSQMVAAVGEILDEYLEANEQVLPVVMRRMNRYEYNNAVRDLLGLKGDIYPLPEKTIRNDVQYFAPASGSYPMTVVVGNRTLGKNQVEKQILTGVAPFAIDLQAEGGFNNRGEELSLSPILLESFLSLGQSVVRSPEFEEYCTKSKELFGEPGKNAELKETASARLRPLLERAFRKKVDNKLLQRYCDFVVQRSQDLGSFSAAMKDAVAAILASPSFIYLAEHADSGQSDGGITRPQPDDVRSDVNATESEISAFELATRLSFFLWSSIPDQELWDRANDGSLRENDVLREQVERMLEDPRSQALSQNFARQWLRLDQLVAAVPDFERYEKYYSRIGCEQWKFGLQTMLEPLLLFESIMVEDRSIMLLLDSDYAFRSDELQSWYQDAEPFSGRQNRNRFNTNQQPFSRRKVEDRREGGVLTTAAVLTMTSQPLRTSPIVRGAWVATVLFNQPPPPPPDDVPPIEADEQAIEASGLTLRERLEQHQVNASCVACHAKIDPLGFALENFDAVGRWRDKYSSGLEIDASGELFGKMEFQNVVELKNELLQRPELFSRAFIEHMLSYALSRELHLEDAPAVDRILEDVLADRGQFSTVVHGIVNSRSFRYRRNK
ncbi:MAG: DUF1588 domain-containing protein [Planctomycetota bacterium]